MTEKKKFKYEVTREQGGEEVLSCYGCGTCTAGCPVRALDPRYNPRRIIKHVLLGDRSILENEEIWLCTSCYTCQERCPQDVRITDLINALRNMATAAGHCPPGVSMQSQFVAEFGRLYELSDFDAKKREKLGLPTLKIDLEKLDALFGDLVKSQDNDRGNDI